MPSFMIFKLLSVLVIGICVATMFLEGNVVD